jgi:hypothetical protein
MLSPNCCIFCEPRTPASSLACSYGIDAIEANSVSLEKTLLAVLLNLARAAVSALINSNLGPPI